MPFTVYALVDPRTDKVRYIGCTTQSLDRRLRQHLGDQVASPRKYQWLAELRQANLEPLVVALEEAEDAPAERERYWISLKRAEGCDLLNADARSVSESRRQFGEAVQGWATGAESAMIDVLEAQADADIEERLRDDRDGKERTSLRWGREQVNVVREAARLAGVPYETYIKLVVYRQALADVQAAQQIGQRT